MNNVFVHPFLSVFIELPFLTTAGDINSYLGLLTFLLFGLIWFSFLVSSSKATPRRLSRLKILFEKFQTSGNIVAVSPVQEEFLRLRIIRVRCSVVTHAILQSYQTFIIVRLKFVFNDNPKVLTVVCFRLVELLTLWPHNRQLKPLCILNATSVLSIKHSHTLWLLQSHE